MNNAMPESRRCEVCGDQIRLNNKYGICSDQGRAGCVSARRRKRLGLPEPGETTCEICGRPLRVDNKTGICSDRGNTECRRVRKRMDRGVADPRAGRHLITIKPGDTFGRWTALEDYDPKRKRVLCRCECGTERHVRGTNLIGSESRSCGCGPYKARLREAPYLPAGTVSGRLTALEDVAFWSSAARCRCECGGEVTVKAIQVKLGSSRSCGCLTGRHGFSKHPLYSTWASMIQRCTNPNHNAYRNYGGRTPPVTVCDRWRDPWLFAEDVMREIGLRPGGKDEKGRALYEFDRVNNDLGYGPGNVRWADKKTQRANQRTIADLARKLAEALVRAEKAEAQLGVSQASQAITCL